MIYKTLLIGLGQIGMGYDFDESSTSKELVLSHAQAISIHDDFQLVGGVDSCPQRRDKFTDKFARPSYEDLADALDASQPDVVIIATSTGSHLEVCEAVLSQMKPKVIVLEKPLAYSADDSYAIIELGKLSCVPIAVNYFRAYEPEYQNLLDRFSQGLLGFPLTAIVKYTNGMINNGSHWVQYLSSCFGEVQGVNISSHHAGTNCDFVAEAKISFSKGVAHFIPFQELEYYLFEIEIYGPLGKVAIDSSGNNIREYLAQPDPAFPSLNILRENPTITKPAMAQYQSFIYDEIKSFLDGDGELSCTTESLLSTVEIYSQLERQLEEK